MDMPQIMLRICNRFFTAKMNSVFFSYCSEYLHLSKWSALFWVLVHLFVIDSPIHI